jgi:sugar lactone lactonase YvrE
MIGQVVCIAPVRDHCGEGVVWDGARSAIYWTDVTRFLIHRLEVVNQVMREWHFDEPVVALSLTTKAETLLVALGSRLILWNPNSDARVEHGFKIDEWPDVRLNEGRTDPAGDFWVGSMCNNVNPDGSLRNANGSVGKLYRVAATGASSVWRDAIGISNTMCWSPDRRRFYFGDSLANTIYSYDRDPQCGAILNEKPFFKDFDRGCPDGSVVDSEGYLWNCRFGGGCVVRVAPDGQIDRVIEMPTRNPTTCTFGGEGLMKLFITSAAILSEPEDDLAGGLFELTVDVPGLPESRFRIA